MNWRDRTRSLVQINEPSLEARRERACRFAFIQCELSRHANSMDRQAGEEKLMLPEQQRTGRVASSAFRFETVRMTSFSAFAFPQARQFAQAKK